MIEMRSGVLNRRWAQIPQERNGGLVSGFLVQWAATRFRVMLADGLAMGGCEVVNRQPPVGKNDSEGG